MTDLLCYAVKITADLNQTIKGGQTKREHLEHIEKQTGKSQIPEYEIPVAGLHLWGWFWDLSNKRQSGFGLSAIAYSEIESWIRIRRISIHDWEIDILLKMDRAFLEQNQENSKNNEEQKQN